MAAVEEGQGAQGGAGLCGEAKGAPPRALPRPSSSTSSSASAPSTDEENLSSPPSGERRFRRVSAHGRAFAAAGPSSCSTTRHVPAPLPAGEAFETQGGCNSGSKTEIAIVLVAAQERAVARARPRRRRRRRAPHHQPVLPSPVPHPITSKGAARRLPVRARAAVFGRRPGPALDGGGRQPDEQRREQAFGCRSTCT